MGIGDKIKARRIEMGLSQDELASKLGYSSRSSVSKIEKGFNDIPQSKIKAFADALDTTPAYLLGLEDEKESETLDNQIHTIAAHAERPLTDEEIDEVMEYAKYIIAKHSKEKK